MSANLTVAGIRALLGKLVGESAKTIASATNAPQAVFTVTAGHGYSVGDVIFVSGTTGNTALNGVRVVATVPLSTTFTCTDLFTGADVDGNGTTGGSPIAKRIKCGLTPGDLVDLLASLDKVSSALGPFSDANRAAESSLSTIFSA